MFKGLGNLTSLMRQAQQIGGRLNSIRDELKSERVRGTSGGGMIEVEVNGMGEVLKLTIDPTLVERGEQEMIEDLIPAAVNQALQKARQLHSDAIKSLTHGMDIPGLDDAIDKFTGGAN